VGLGFFLRNAASFVILL